MTGKAMILVFVFLLIFTLENIFSFQKKGQIPFRHLIRNLCFALMTALLAYLFTGGFKHLFAYLEQSGKGLLNYWDLGITFQLLAAIILFDVWMYMWHRMNHEFAFFWKFHRMHHTDPAMDTTTAFRFHPGEILFSNIFNIIIFSFIGLSLSGYAIYRVLLFPVIVFHHSNIDLPEWIDKRLRWLIVTPHMHKVHHSHIREETNSNYGSIFSFWDRIFGSFRLRKELQSIIYGIGAFHSEKYQSVKGMLQIPFKKIRAVRR